MENTSPETTTAAAAETTKAPVRRSRRATAATGETVAAPTVAVTADAAAGSTETVPAAPKKRTPRTRTVKAATEVVTDTTTQADAVAHDVAHDAAAPVVASESAELNSTAPKKRVTRSRKKAEPAVAAETETTAASTTVVTETTEPTAQASEEPAAGAVAPKKRQTRSRKKAAEAEAAVASSEAEAVAKPTAETVLVPAAETVEEPPAAPTEKPQRTRNRNGQNRRGAATSAQPENDPKTVTPAPVEETEAATDKNDTKSAVTKSEESKTTDTQARTNRTRQRERKRRGQGDDFEVDLNEDDVLLPIAGILDVLDNYAFVRTSGYLPGTNDVYVSLGQVKKYDLRKGDAVVGAIRQPRDNEGNGRQKYNAIVRVDSVNSRLTDEANTRPEFMALTAVNPDTVLQLETTTGGLTGRMLDLFTPIGGGQRAIVRGATATGKSQLLRDIAAAVSQNSPDTHIMYVAVDARPEEITELQRSINGEVIGSSFDRPVEDHTTAAELAIERAKRLVELGHHVVVLLDSVTRLGRAFQQQHVGNSRVATTGFEAVQIAPLKRMLAAARNVENGGSLTIVTSANLGSISQLDERILEEIESVWNANVVLSQELARLGDYPAIDLAASATRDATALIGESAVSVLSGVRRAIAQETVIGASAGVRSQLEATANNVEFLALAQRKQGL